LLSIDRLPVLLEIEIHRPKYRPDLGFRAIRSFAQLSHAIINGTPNHRHYATVHRYIGVTTWETLTKYRRR